MIFVSGVHGVGKSFFCNMVKNTIGIESYSASKLIEQKKNAAFSQDNQPYLLQAVNELKESGVNFILDGHFCLLNSLGEITRISLDTFQALNPDAILLLMEKPDVIAARRKERDGIDVSVQSIHDFQQEECSYAKEVAANIGAKLFISYGKEDLSNAIAFLKTV